MIISVCVGSSCHLKHSYQVIDMFKNAIQSHGLENNVELKASFCLNNCMNAVSFKIDEEPCESITLESFDTVFKDKVLRKLANDGTDQNPHK